MIEHFLCRKYGNNSCNNSLSSLGDDEDRLVIAEEEPMPSETKKPSVSKSKGGSKDRPVKPRRKQNRFNGMSEEEVSKRLLPDLITQGLQILIVSRRLLVLRPVVLVSLKRSMG